MYEKIGNINLTLFQALNLSFATDEVVLTDERKKHIIQRHSDDFYLFYDSLSDIINNIDYVVKDSKNDDTVFVIAKHYNDNINIVIKLALAEQVNYKHSIMTFWRIRDKNINKLLKNNNILYKKH